MSEKIFAAIVVAGCLALLVRLVLGDERRARLARAWRRLRDRVGGRLLGSLQAPGAQRRARKEAEAAIRRARGRAGEWDGNVYRPSSFDKRGKKREQSRRDLH